MQQTPKKSRETLIAETTDRLLGDWAVEIKAGEPRAISDLHNTVLDRLSEDDAKAIFIQSVLDPAGAENLFQNLTAKAMRDVCAADAERTVDLLLGDLVAAKTEARIERVLDAQAA
ncbi:hypothetical protein [Massilia varians]|uniref:hypothetical protein n=1 Tax=Massilia varians TaxID=457921 RepID=UPI0025560A32|nr:hypothetical protein [Massilia varians]MDK6077914.1 hypothetical protein [Massilia varians]